jgi:hypothetical protein
MVNRLTKSAYCLHSSLLIAAFVGIGAAADESFFYQFLGSPLLILIVLLIIDALALLYHRVRK